VAIQRLAIVNRGEPAVRLLNAVAELNAERPADERITTIALFTDPDAQSWFVRAADEAVSLGSPTFVDPSDDHRKSRYLDEPGIMAALAAARADAVWVGWGFVSERASFASRCEEAGITFVGPRAETIRRLGDKVTSKRIAEQAGVPVVPWNGGPVEDVEEALKHAEQLGYPVVLKASAGGGGRGIRIVRDAAEMPTALASARSEAGLAFGDPTVFMEEFLPAARHVEVQVIADGQGATWAVGIRDCSVQRRNQKVLEESASTVLSPEKEREIMDSAVRLAEAVDYRNAGTIEFLVSTDGERYLFMEVNTRLQVEHPVTEATTGLDLVKMQIHVANGGRLEGSPPPRIGHAIEARLNAEDPEQAFSPAPGLVAMWRPPQGSGIRVDSGVRQDDRIAPEFDSMIAKVIAWGKDRDEAIARLSRGMAQSVVVVEGGTTNKSFILGLLRTEEVLSGNVHNRWLDTITATGDHLPAPDPLALVIAAVEAYDAEHATEQAAFHARAARGRPDNPDAIGHKVSLRYRGDAYAFTTYLIGPGHYRVVDGTDVADLHVQRINEYERVVSAAGRRHRVVAVSQGPVTRIEVDGTAHLILRDDGGLIRAGAPAFVVALLVEPGQRVEEGDPIAVLESMKMEMTVTAPFGGTIASIETGPNVQIDTGSALLRISADQEVAFVGAAGDRVSIAGYAEGPERDEKAFCRPVYRALGRYLLGYDLEPARLKTLLAEQRRLEQGCSAADDALLACENEFLDLFTDVAGLYRPRPQEDVESDLVSSTQEYLLSYLQWLDPERAGLPDTFRDRLATALERYGVSGLDRSPELESAVVWMFRSFSRVSDLAPAVSAVLTRWLAQVDELRPHVGPTLRARLDGLAGVTAGRHQALSDLARDVRFRYVDEPQFEANVAEAYAEMDEHFRALVQAPPEADVSEHATALVACPQPLRGRMLRQWLGHDQDAARRRLLEVHAQRFYRIRELRDLSVDEHQGHLLASANYDHLNMHVHLVVGYTGLASLPDLAQAIAEHLDEVAEDGTIVIELVAWRSGVLPDADVMAAEVHGMLDQCEFGRRVHRVDLTLTHTDGDVPEHLRTQHFTFRQHEDGQFGEDPLYRNLHPMLAKRFDLWRLSNFELSRLASPEDVYLFRGVAHANPKDVRLFALAEVRDLTPSQPDAAHVVHYPALERIGMAALAAMRQALAALPARQRPTGNRLVLYVRPPFDVPRRSWPELARQFAPLAAGTGLEKVVLRVSIPQPDGGTEEAVLHVEGPAGRGVTVRVRPVGDEPIRPMTPYRQKVLTAQRFGAPYPYEIVRMLAPRPGTQADFPPGRFVEHDLDEDGRIIEVGTRDLGKNTANIVFGLITNYTDTVPEGMTRVAILGDPTSGLGNLAEPECRRIIAALDMAEERGIPAEWFAVSSGARIAMDSGSENMDWISGVLRRIIEYTQNGGELNVVVTGINVGAQPYWNAEATMLMHTRGILIMTPSSAMVLTGKQALDFSGGVSAEDNYGIGGYDRIMGINGQGQYWAPTVQAACEVLLRHYDHTYVVPGERFPRRHVTDDPIDRDVRTAPHAPTPGVEFTSVGDVFSAERNPERKKPFDIRSVMRAVADSDSEPLERWKHWREAEISVVWDTTVGGIPVCMLGLESRTLARRGYVPADGPSSFTSGTLFPQSSRKTARAINAASNNRPLVVLANLSGFDGSPESMRRWQLEYGSEIGRAITNFRGPIVFVVISRYHGGAFVVFSKRLNASMEVAAVEGSFASVIGGAPAAATVFSRDVKIRTENDPRVVALREKAASADPEEAAALRTELAAVTEVVRSEKLGEVADEFDSIHTIQRAQRVGSVDRIVKAADLRPYVVDALERGIATAVDAVTP
jgi:acetyl/propionyl-CoA carboxylase alpha subunit/acetyl-CoA carboxylase carboxyltransferase component